jgi:hypothetical protein
MTPKRHRLPAIALTLTIVFSATVVRAQVTETPAAFDSAGRVHALTPALVARLKLQPPAWPVAGAFREARLFASSAGGHVLAVERAGGAIERFSLSAEETAQLRSTIDVALAQTGAIGTEERADVVSEPARGAFVRDQMLTTWTLYGPLLSFIAGDSRLAAAAYLFATGASYFFTNQVAGHEQVTRAQNALTTDGGFRGAAFGAGALYVLAGEQPEGKSFAAAALAGGLGTAVFAFHHARPMTDAEVEATTAFSTLGAATMFLSLGTVGAIGDSAPTRGVIAPTLGAAIAGYALGARYARRTTYGVTRGDVQLLKLGAGLGAMAGLAPFVGSDVDSKVIFGALTAGLVGGGLLTHQKWVRPYEHSTADATQVHLGATAGLLLGMGVNVLTEPAVQGGFAIMTGGAILGAIAGHNIANPPRAGAPRADASDEAAHARPAVEFHFENLAFVAARQSGLHPVMTFRF